MYFFNYFMDLNKAPEDVMKDRWYTTNLENIDFFEIYVIMIMVNF